MQTLFPERSDPTKAARRNNKHREGLFFEFILSGEVPAVPKRMAPSLTSRSGVRLKFDRAWFSVDCSRHFYSLAARLFILSPRQSLPPSKLDESGKAGLYRAHAAMMKRHGLCVLFRVFQSAGEGGREPRAFSAEPLRAAKPGLQTQEHGSRQKLSRRDLHVWLSGAGRRACTRQARKDEA